MKSTQNHLSGSGNRKLVLEEPRDLAVDLASEGP
jgi:hypothetical protein